MAVVLRQLREERNWSRAVLSKRAGVGEATIARIETRQVNERTGKVDVPKPVTLTKLARALGDGNGERAREARLKLFAAAGHADDAEEPDVDAETARELERLRERVEALERRTAPDVADIEQEIRRLLSSYPDSKRQMALSLMREALERFERDRQPPQ